MKAQSTSQEAKINRLLFRLPAAERSDFEAKAKTVDLLEGSVLCEAGMRMSHVYFPHCGVISLLANGGPGEVVHLAHLGEEGMLGMPVAAGASTSPVHAVVHGQGHAAQVDASGFISLLKRCPVLSHSLFVYSHALMAQIAQAVVCNTLHPVPSRLARWLLTMTDRLHSSTVTATQEQIALTLGVLRLSVSHAASELQEAGLIHYRRGVVKVENRAGLKTRACACYGITDKIFRAAVE